MKWSIQVFSTEDFYQSHFLPSLLFSLSTEALKLWAIKKVTFYKKPEKDKRELLMSSIANSIDVNRFPGAAKVLFSILENLSNGDVILKTPIGENIIFLWR